MSGGSKTLEEQSALVRIKIAANALLVKKRGMATVCLEDLRDMPPYVVHAMLLEATTKATDETELIKATINQCPDKTPEGIVTFFCDAMSKKNMEQGVKRSRLPCGHPAKRSKTTAGDDDMEID